ncbi:MAG TPA: DUF6456 domain-containing protein [Aestuariivirga sp.]|nr:DUF6456 domain-containing protein [Aestuariivirga sp.]
MRPESGCGWTTSGPISRLGSPRPGKASAPARETTAPSATTASLHFQSAIDARRRVHNAFDAVGPELSGVLYYMCCLAGGLEQAERMLQLPQRSGKAVLAIALTRLARHYRLLKPPERSAASPDFAHWALADFRPRIMPQEPGAHQP